MHYSMQSPKEQYCQLLTLPHQQRSHYHNNERRSRSTRTTTCNFIYRHAGGGLYSLWHPPTICNSHHLRRKKRSRMWMTMMNTTFAGTNMSLLPTIIGFIKQPQASTQLSFLPDFTEHPKPKIHPSPKKKPKPIADDSNGNVSNNNDDNDDTSNSSDKNSDEITFFHDFIAGGVAGSASVIVGHPFDTIKVRLQTSDATIVSSIYKFGGITSIFRGMTAPLGAAAVINAIVFGSYGFSSRLYDKYMSQPSPILSASGIDDDDDDVPVPILLNHDPWQKSFACGAFAGFVQCFVICPLEHIKCRLQIQVKPSKSKTTTATTTVSKNPTTILKSPEYYNGPIDAVYKITTKYGISRLYQGWYSTLLREVPAFGLYFCTYDYLKDVTESMLIQYWTDDSTDMQTTTTKTTSHTWIASAIAGGLSGSLTWAIVYPVDLIKSHIQTRSLTTPLNELRMLHVGKCIVQKHGVSYLFRGLNITLLRALPVNGKLNRLYKI